MVSSKTVERFLERIAKDDAKLSVTNFRMSVPLMEADYQYYKGIKEWQHVYPAAEFNKDESGNLVFQKSNGLVMLHFINLMSDQEKDAVKKTVSLLPMTFEGSEGHRQQTDRLLDGIFFLVRHEVDEVEHHQPV